MGPADSCYTGGVIAFQGLLFGYFELGLVAAGILLTGLLFLRHRPPGLVWVSAATMGVLLAHLIIESGRWQLIPLYALVFSFSIWLAVPTAKSFRAGGLVVRIVLAVLVLLPSLALPVVVPVFEMPEPDGPYGVGMATLAIPGDQTTIDVFYPTDPAAEPVPDAVLAPYWSLREVNERKLPGFPWLCSTHLALVPTNALLRGPIANRVFPIAVALPGEQVLPSDFLAVTEQVASLGWIVVETPPEISAEQLVRILELFRTGDLDAAFEGAADTNRLVMLGLGAEPAVELGVPTLTLGAGTLVSMRTAGGSYGVDLPDARIPGPAVGNRHLLVRPHRFLIGSSDVPPADIATVIRAMVNAVLGQGEMSSPVFSGEPLQPALGDVQRALAGILPDFTVQPIPDLR